MEPIKPANTYAARPAGTATYENGGHVFKIYYVDIYGRSEPERYEWDLCGRPRQSLIEGLAQAGVEGIGFVVAFPHITKVFRFAPSAETVMHVKGYRTESFKEMDLAREEGYVEFACYAEALIAADEYRLWAEAASVSSYLEMRSEWDSAPVRDNTKLARHFAE